MRIPLTDNAGASLSLDIDDKSDAVQLGLASLSTATSAVAKFANETLDATGFQTAAFGGDYKTPKLAIRKDLTFCVKGGVNTSLTLLKKAEDLAELGLAAEAGDLWLVFRVESTVTVAGSAVLPAGFGVAGKEIAVRSAAVYTKFSKSSGFPTVLNAVNRAISNFRVARTADDAWAQPTDTICEADVSGKFVLEASYTYPLAINALTLVKAPLPLHKKIDVVPNVGLTLDGQLAVSGEFRTRVHKVSEAALRMGLYKKRQTALTAAFTAAAGLAADSGGADLLPTLFSALSKENVDAAALSADDKKALRTALGAALDLGFSIALNLSCTAAHADEAAVLYEAGMTAGAPAAIDQALGGDWTALDSCAGAKKLKTVTTSTRDAKFAATVNLLGIYEYASVSEFAKACTILHDAETSTITITDKVTGQRIMAAGAPFVADRRALHKLLQESFLATAVYNAADANVKLSVKQSLLVYKAHRSYADLKKDMQLGEALRLLAAQDVDTIGPQKDFTFYRVAASAEYNREQTTALFFADAGTETSWTLEQLKGIGRRALVALLDANDAVDAGRIKALEDPGIWAQMDAQKFPSQASRGDWYDITEWAGAMAEVGPKLKAVMAARKNATGDPAQNAAFMKAREEMAQALGEATHNIHAAFDPGWAIAVMFALGGARAAVTFQAQWDGTTRFDKKSALVQHA